MQIEGKKCFINESLYTFYLRLYGVRHMVKDHSDSQRGNPLQQHGLLFSISNKGSFICIIPDRITHTTVFVTPVVEHWLELEIAQWVKDRFDNLSHHERTLLPRSYISLPSHHERTLLPRSYISLPLLNCDIWLYQLCAACDLSVKRLV